MRLADFAIGSKLPLLQNSPLWKRDVSTIKPLDMSIFIRGFENPIERAKAQAEVDQIMADCWEYCIATGEEPPNLIAFANPSLPMSMDELESRLLKLSVERRRAILFCLETGMKVEDVVALTWKMVPRLDISDYAHKIINSQARHIKLPYVFWERCSDIVALPMVGLGQNMIELSDGLGYGSLRARYLELLPISYNSDFEATLRAFK